GRPSRAAARRSAGTDAEGRSLALHLRLVAADLGRALRRAARVHAQADRRREEDRRGLDRDARRRHLPLHAQARRRRARDVQRAALDRGLVVDEERRLPAQGDVGRARDHRRLAAVGARDRRARVEQVAAHHVTSSAPPFRLIDDFVIAMLCWPNSIETPSASSVSFAPEAASTAIASLPCSSIRRMLWPPGVMRTSVSGPASSGPSPSAQTPPDQIGTRVVSPADHSTKTRLPTGGTAARPMPEPAYGLHGRHQPVSSSPSTSGTWTRTRESPFGSSLSTTTPRYLPWKRSIRAALRGGRPRRTARLRSGRARS